ncbi:MAG: hypothetical protein II642_10380, partial [Firmicutes bacterium]|nr:hypothetical protein [Bacillota bacterium]
LRKKLHVLEACLSRFFFYTKNHTTKPLNLQEEAEDLLWVKKYKSQRKSLFRTQCCEKLTIE